MGLPRLTKEANVHRRDARTAVIQNDARSLPLPASSVDLIVTSPPYFSFREYQEEEGRLDAIGDEEKPSEYLRHLGQCMTEWDQILKPTGSVFVNIGDKYAGSGGSHQSGIKTAKKSKVGGYEKFDAPARYKPPEGPMKPRSLMGLPWRFANEQVDNGWILRAEIIWAKTNSIPDPAPNRAWRIHEHIFHFTKEPVYFSDLAERPPLKSVWPLVTEPFRVTDEQREFYGLPDHFAAFPSEIPRRIILGFSPEDGVVLDPFGGSGTTAGVARMLGRFGISNDLSSAYSRLAAWRVWESGHFKKTVDRTWADMQLSFE